jgi:hypothetical protein
MSHTSPWGARSAIGLATVVTAALAAAQPSQVGQWSGPASWPLVASHAALLADGRVLVWSDQSGVTPHIWDPATESSVPVPAIHTNVIGSTQARLLDGDVAVLGGRDGSGVGIQDAHEYDLATSSWNALPNLLQGRDAGTALTLGDGRLLVLGGDRDVGLPADVPEVAVQGSSWAPLSTAVLALPRTPWAFALSDGTALVAGPDRATRRLVLANQGSWNAVSDLLAGSRSAGTAVLVPGTTDRVLAIGGRNPAVATCEVLDLQTTTSWDYTGSMSRARRHHHATILADGTVLVTGGTLVDDALEHAVLQAERWSTATGTWTALASMTVPRRRGSIALLLPDARVLVAGGGDGSAGSETHPDAEIYAPPYLFAGTRPALAAAPAVVEYGTTFVADTPQAASIAAVWLVRAGSTAGGFGADQRALSLAFTAGSGQLAITAPGGAAAAPPGTWMLFIVNGSGVPSSGKLLWLGSGSPVPIPPDITTTPPTTTLVNAQYTYVPAVTGTPPIAWSLVTAPSWLAVSPGTGAVAGVPTTTGSFVIALRATNAAGSDTQSWTLEVTTGVSVRTVVPLGATWRYFKGTANPPSSWAARVFDDAAWLQGPSGFGFGDNDDATVLSDMVNNYTTVFTRKSFEVYNVHTVSKVSILYEYDDGFAVFLNGMRIFALRAPTTITNTSVATGSHEAGSTLVRRDLTDAATLALLVNGANALAAVGLNSSISSSDLTLKVVLELTGGTDTPVDAAGDPAGAAAAALQGLAHPNPFAGATRIAFLLSRPGTARLDVYDAAGRQVRRLQAPGLAPGPQALGWDGRDEAGRPLAPGVYLYRLHAPGVDLRGKIVRAK